MLTHQVKVTLDREADGVLARIAHRDGSAKAAVIRRIALAAVRAWERAAAPMGALESRTSTDDEASGFDVPVKVLFSEADLQRIARLAAGDGVSVARCIRRTVAWYVRRITGRPTHPPDESRLTRPSPESGLPLDHDGRAV